MNRRQLLQGASATVLLPGSPMRLAAQEATSRARRVRPGDPDWPSQAEWNELGRAVGGRLQAVTSPLTPCLADPGGDVCAAAFARLNNPYYLSDTVGLTQALGWVGAWTSQPSAYAVGAESAADVVAAVNFAREHNLRLVVKGGGHSYQGRSNAPDSLLIWTRAMDRIEVHEGFVAAGCSEAPQPAVTVGAGALWGHVYDAVTTGTRRYVQGGGCLTVGVAGLIQSGGFGPFSKTYGLAAASLLEAEVVTADGQIRIANACSEPELFWALKGGGGSSLGVITRLTLKTHDLPATLGAVNFTVRAGSDDAYRRLIAHIVAFYAQTLFGPTWGEQIVVRPDNALTVAMVFHGLSEEEARATWRPVLDWVQAEGYGLDGQPFIVAAPAQQLWNPEFLKQIPGLVMMDDRPDAPAGNIYWASNQGEAGQVLHGYQSAWLPADLLQPARQAELVEALYAASRHWGLSLHLNKGLAGAPENAIAAARDTATNPAALDAFALAISGAEGPPAWAGIAGREPDEAVVRGRAHAVAAAMGELLPLVPAPASYFSESDFFTADWQQAFWGANYPRLQEAKRRYDPDGLFFVHHGVGSEDWSADGFTRLR